ncbi:hypothetical protein AB0N05_37790 [Nocardia sp. NPDC051030]|uniref:hypothetical protein n=1 Tax=Nocardia sp. NPDC051030 TaxID=3155162 RepID=UPI003419814C
MNRDDLTDRWVTRATSSDEHLLRSLTLLEAITQLLQVLVQVLVLVVVLGFGLYIAVRALGLPPQVAFGLAAAGTLGVVEIARRLSRRAFRLVRAAFAARTATAQDGPGVPHGDSSVSGS